MHKYAVLYHRGCNDGLASAWAAKRYLGDEAIYLPYQYGDKVPDTINGLHLFLVDLSMSTEQLFDLVATRVPSVMVIDHHKSAEADLAPFRTIRGITELNQRLNDESLSEEPKVFKFFSTGHCGAILTWAFFADVSPNDSQARKLMPQQLIYIDDYDRWVKQYPETDVINTWLINGKSDPDRVGQIMSPDRISINREVMLIGQTLIDYDARITRSVIRDYAVYRDHYDATRRVMIKVAWVNAPHHLRNRISDEVLKQEKADIVVCYSMRRDKIIYSLRGNEAVDVSIIAAAFGGGGHPAAAAFAITRDVDHGLPHFALLSPATWRERIRFMWSVFWNRQK